MNAQPVINEWHSYITPSRIREHITQGMEETEEVEDAGESGDTVVVFVCSKKKSVCVHVCILCECAMVRVEVRGHFRNAFNLIETRSL